MNNTGKKILEKIEEENIKPKAKYSFWLKKNVLIISSVITILLGSISLAIIIFFINNQELNSFTKHPSNWQIIFSSLPYLWILILIAFSFLVYYNLKHTEFGYRLTFIKIMGIYLSLIIILGISSYYLGLADKLQNTFIANSPLYKNYTYNRLLIWQNPENGRLAGKMFLNESNNIILKDLRGDFWILDTTEAKRPPFELPNNEIKIIGSIIEENNFKVYEIRPLFSPREVYLKENKRIPCAGNGCLITPDFDNGARINRMER